MAVHHLTSPDGIEWTSVAEGPLLMGEELRGANDEVYTAPVSSVLVEDDGTWALYFSTVDRATIWPPTFEGGIGRATVPSPTGPWMPDDDLELNWLDWSIYLATYVGSLGPQQVCGWQTQSALHAALNASDLAAGVYTLLPAPYTLFFCMQMTVQIILKEGKAVIPYETYLSLVEDTEMLQDNRDYDAAMEALASREELGPTEIAYPILDRANPMRVWQPYHGLSQRQLAERAGISGSRLSQIETGKRTGTAEVLRTIAVALKLSLNNPVV